eukprot:349990-Chlamydomonas_euryale.AAC.21
MPRVTRALCPFDRRLLLARDRLVRPREHLCKPTKLQDMAVDALASHGSASAPQHRRSMLGRQSDSRKTSAPAFTFGNSADRSAASKAWVSSEHTKGVDLDTEITSSNGSLESSFLAPCLFLHVHRHHLGPRGIRTSHGSGPWPWPHPSFVFFAAPPPHTHTHICLTLDASDVSSAGCARVEAARCNIPSVSSFRSRSPRLKVQVPQSPHNTSVHPVSPPAHLPACPPVDAPSCHFSRLELATCNHRRTRASQRQPSAGLVRHGAPELRPAADVAHGDAAIVRHRLVVLARPGGQDVPELGARGAAAARHRGRAAGRVRLAGRSTRAPRALYATQRA